jgi:hypothetical protein
LASTTKTGWIRLTPDTGTSTPFGAGVFGYNPNNILVTESGVPAAAATTHAHVYVDLSIGHNTGLAIANISNTHTIVNLRAYKADGVIGIGFNPTALQLPINGHDAQFANQYVSGLTAGFTGVLDITSANPFAALTVRSLYNERGEFLIATFPIADMTRPAPWPIVFPQIADGGGYLTQFILLGAGAASSATLHFSDQEGKPLPVGKR